MEECVWVSSRQDMIVCIRRIPQLLRIFAHIYAYFAQCVIISATRQDKTAILGEISPIFRSFSTYFPPMVLHLPFFHPHVFGICLFPPISAYFPPKMVPHPCYKLTHGTHLPICCFSAHMFTDSAYLPPMFRSFSAYFSPGLSCLVICLAGGFESEFESFKISNMQSQTNGPVLGRSKTPVEATTSRRVIDFTRRREGGAARNRFLASRTRFATTTTTTTTTEAAATTQQAAAPPSTTRHELGAYIIRRCSNLTF